MTILYALGMYDILEGIGYCNFYLGLKSAFIFVFDKDILYASKCN